jgi:hypothetical protein
MQVHKMILAALVVTLSLVAVRGDVAYACTNSCGVSAQARLIKGDAAISIAGWSGDHTWADAWSSSFDVVNNFHGGGGYCASTGGPAGCSWSYSAWNASWGGTECTNYGFVACQYDFGDNLTYGVTGVCHQSANRANTGFFSVPWARDAGGIGGSGLSFAIWCDCGANVLGICYSCNS